MVCDKQFLVSNEPIPIKNICIDESVSCETGKKPYLNYDFARRALKLFKKRRDCFKYPNRFLWVYRCKFCRRFHVGSQERKIKNNDC